MRMVSGLLCSLVAFAGASSAASAAGSIVVNGKSHVLNHVRAWKVDEMMGRPTSIEVVLAEKPLTNLTYWGSGDHYQKGEFGVVLTFKAALAPGVMPNAPALRFAIGESYNLKVHANDFGGWSETTLDVEGITGNDISLNGSTLQGKLDWKGKVENPSDDKQTVTAWSATFSVPMEDIGPMPGK